MRVNESLSIFEEGSSKLQMVSMLTAWAMLWLNLGLKIDLMASESVLSEFSNNSLKGTIERPNKLIILSSNKKGLHVGVVNVLTDKENRGI